jgi:hypothetical protein
VALTKLHEVLVGNPLQSVIEFITRSRGEQSRHARVGGVSQDVHVDLTVSTPKLTVWVATVRRDPRVAKVVQHVPEQGRKARTVQPIAMNPSVGSVGGVGVVVHLSKTRDRRVNISSIEQRQQTKFHINHNDKKLTRFFFKARQILIWTDNNLVKPC